MCDAALEKPSSERMCRGAPCAESPCDADSIQCGGVDRGTCRVDEATATPVCDCKDGYSGKLCEIKDGCRLNRYGTCCPADRLLGRDGTCCVANATRDGDGYCCNSVVDACGTCSGVGSFTDAAGSCCFAKGQRDAGGLCCYDGLDACGT